MKRKIISILMALSMVAITACGCGSDSETTAEATPEPAVEETTETPTEEPTATPEAEEATQAPTEDATAEPTEEPEEIVSFDADELKSVLEMCIGIRGTAGSSLKWALASETCLAYAVENELSGLNEGSVESFSRTMKEVVDSFTRKQRKSLGIEMQESIMPFITDSFQEWNLYQPDLEDAGAWDSWEEIIKNPHVQDDWYVFWGAYEEIANG